MLLLAEGPDQAFSSSTFFYPVGPLVSRLASAHAKKALEQFKALVLSVSARVWLKPDLGCRGLARSAANIYAAPTFAV